MTNLDIGIDPGVKTGLAYWDKDAKKLLQVGFDSIIGCMGRIMVLWERGCLIHIFFEDARQRKWFADKGEESLQGAGSIKRDCAIWEEFCKFHSIPFTMVPPQKGATKWDAETFKRRTGWTGRTNEHGRDAALLVFGR